MLVVCPITIGLEVTPYPLCYVLSEHSSTPATVLVLLKTLLVLCMEQSGPMSLVHHMFPPVGAFNLTVYDELQLIIFSISEIDEDRLPNQLYKVISFMLYFRNETTEKELQELFFF